MPDLALLARLYRDDAEEYTRQFDALSGADQWLATQDLITRTQPELFDKDYWAVVVMPTYRSMRKRGL